MAQDEPIPTRVTETLRRTTAKRANRTWLWLGSAMVSATVAIAAIAVMLNSGEKRRCNPPRQRQTHPRQASRGVPPPASLPPNRLAPQSSSTTPPVSSFGPRQLAAPHLARLRPRGNSVPDPPPTASIAAHPEGERVLAALGPWGRGVVDQLQSIVGGDFAEIDALLIAVTVSDANQLEASLRVEFATPIDDAALAKRLPAAKQAEQGDVPTRTLDGRSYFLAYEPTPALIVAPTALAAELIDSMGEPPPLVRDVEALAEQSDDDRDATVIVSPKFLQASGNDLLTAEAAPLHDALRWLLGEEATAIALSLDWGDDFFAELRATPALNVPPRRLAAKLRERIVAMPAEIEETVLAEPWHPYGRKVIARLPGMLRTLARYTRAGEEDREAIVRAYLPAAAGHNLLMAGELLLTQPHGDDASAVAGAPASAPSAPTSLAEKLAGKTSLSFTKESLEQAVALLAEDMGVEIVIVGGDLQLDGITKTSRWGSIYATAQRAKSWSKSFSGRIPTARRPALPTRGRSWSTSSNRRQPALRSGLSSRREPPPPNGAIGFPNHFAYPAAKRRQFGYNERLRATSKSRRGKPVAGGPRPPGWRRQVA